jgi:hypothetical protein
VQATVATVLGPLVAELAASRQTNERQAERVAELERENGRLTERLALTAPAETPVQVHTAPPAVTVAADPRTDLSWRAIWLYAALFAAFVGATLLLWFWV